MTHSTALTLAPCPFCGSQPELHKDKMLGDAWLGCMNRSCTVAPYVEAADLSERGGEATALEAWNRRAELAASADAGKLAQEAKRLAGLVGMRGGYEKCAEAIDQLAALSRPAPATTAPVSAQGDEVDAARLDPVRALICPKCGVDRCTMPCPTQHDPKSCGLQFFADHFAARAQQGGQR